MTPEEKAGLEASYEVEWWKAHHRKQFGRLIDQMSQLYVSQFGLDEATAYKAVMLRTEAAKLHDLAEKYEDSLGHDQHLSAYYWELTKQKLKDHFLILNGITRKE